MRGHVVGAFVVVPEVGMTVGNKFREIPFEIPSHLGFGVFADNERRAGMMDEDVAESANDAGPLNDRLDLAADLSGSPSWGLDRKGLVMKHLRSPLPRIKQR